MVFQKSNPFPKSIFENVAYGLRDQRPGAQPASCNERVEESLKLGRHLGRGQGSPARLGARALGRTAAAAVHRPGAGGAPEVLLMDEPASALDPIATQRIEELIYDLKKQYTIVIVTHNMQQAARVSDYTAFFWLGRWSSTIAPTRCSPRREKLTEDYVTGRFG
jgi:phosphate transport system ATP-binding protein